MWEGDWSRVALSKDGGVGRGQLVGVREVAQEQGGGGVEGKEKKP